MSMTKYLVLAAIGLGAVAIGASTAEAYDITNRTVGWCQDRPTEDQSIIASDSAVLLWKADGNLVFAPTNHFASQIWSSGTAGRGEALCFSDTGALTIHDAAGAKIWSYGGTTVPTYMPGLELDRKYDWVTRLKVEGCTLAGTMTLYEAAPDAPEPTEEQPWQPTGRARWGGWTWRKQGVCPVASKHAISTGWCINPGASGPQTILQGKWADLLWRPYSGLLQLVGTGTGTGTAAGPELWKSQTNGTGQSYKVCFEHTGRLAIFDQSGTPRWSTPAGPTTTGYMLGIDQCRLDITPLDGSPVRSVVSPACPQTRMWNNKDVPAGDIDVVLLENDHSRLVYQPDGNLVLRTVSGDELWHSAVPAYVGKRLAFQPDGNLVIYDASNAPKWAANVAGQGVSMMTLEGCAFTLNATIDFTNHPRWSRGSKTCASSELTNSPSWSLTRSGNLTLLRTAEARLVWRKDGNLVLYTTGGAPVWASNTNGKGKRLEFQSDNNLVIYGTDVWGREVAFWASGTAGRQDPHTLKLGGNCTLTIADPMGTRWTGNNVCRVLDYSFDRADGNSTFGSVMYTDLTADSGATARVDSRTGIDVTIFGGKKNLFTATASQDQGGAEATSITISGVSAPDVNVSYSQELWEQEKTFMAGPVPVVISAAASGELGLSFSVSSGGTMSIKPSAGIYAVVEAGVGVGTGFAGAKAGVRGGLTLIEIALPITIKVTATSNQRTYSIQGDLTIGTLSGSLALFAKAYIEVWGIEISAEWSYTFFDWDGFEWNQSLFKKTGTF